MQLVIWAGGRWRAVCGESGRVSGWRRRARVLRLRAGRLLPAALPLQARRGPPVPALPPRPAERVHKFRAPLTLSHNHNNRIDKQNKPRKHSTSKDACVQTDTKSIPTGVDKENKTKPATSQTQDNDRPYKATVVHKKQETESISSERPPVTRPKASSPFRLGEKVGSKRGSHRPLDSLPESAEQVKELLVAVEDVQRLRAYIASHNTNIDLDKFDSSEWYRTRVFFSLNPLVLAARCPRTAAAARRHAAEHFASTLGLQPRARAQPLQDAQPRRRLRRRDVRSVVTRASPDSVVTRTSPASDVTRTSPASVVTRTSRASDAETRRPAPAAVATAQAAAALRGRGRGYRHELASNRKRPVFVPKRSSVPPGREYSALEDHAIVAWLSASSKRERAVNGNLVWRQLEQEYTALTGQTRSFHSLRNRYLRYILPALAALALPQHHAQRLRANAALGELKSRKRSASPAPQQLRAHRPARPAHTPRQRSPPPPTPPPPPPPAPASPPPPPPPPPSARRRDSRRSLRTRSRSTSTSESPARALRSSRHSPSPSPPGRSELSLPRTLRPRQPPLSYDELTRQFALKHRDTRSTSSHDTNAASPAPAQPAAGPKRRRLYNPA